MAAHCLANYTAQVCLAGPCKACDYDVGIGFKKLAGKQAEDLPLVQLSVDVDYGIAVSLFEAKFCLIYKIIKG